MRRKIILILLASFFSVAFLFACGDQNETEKSGAKGTYEDVKKESEKAMESTTDYTHEKKEEYVRQMEAKLEEFDKEMKEFQAKVESRAAELKEESKAEFNQSMEALGKKKQAADEKIEELKSAGSDAWDDLKVGVDSAMDELARTLDRVRSYFEN